MTLPVFETRAELVAWTRQRLRYPDPAPDAHLRALEDIRAVTLAHGHLMEGRYDDLAS